MTSKDKALKRAKGKVYNLVKGNEGKVDDKGEKAKLPYKFQKDTGAKDGK